MTHQIDELIEIAESASIEFKQEIPAKEELVALLCAFANTAGGDLYIGISDNIPRQILGISEESAIKAEEQITSIIADSLFPLVIPFMQLLNVKGKYIIRIHVETGFQRPYKIKSGKNKGKSYVRIGSSNRIADQATIQHLQLVSSGLSWDKLVCQHVRLDELDSMLINEFLDLRYSRRAIPKPDGDINKWLCKMNFAVKSQGLLSPTNAGVLFFHKSPGEILAQTTLEMARFKGISSEIFLDKQSTDSPVWKQYNAALEFFRKHIPLKAIRTAEGRIENYEYPDLAFRELMINALCHRSYEDGSSPVRLAIFDDIIEITNSGTLPDGLELEDIGTGVSVLRNPIIAKGFNEIGLIEGWGTGVLTAQQKLREEYLPEAKISLKGFFTQVSSQWRWQHDLSSIEQMILNYIAKHAYVNSSQIATLCQFSDRSARNHLSALVKKGLIAKTGTTRSSEYSLK